MSNYIINDYEVLARIDHKYGHFYAFSSDPRYAEVVKHYKEHGEQTHCDICGHKIERNDTFLIFTDKGYFLQVGRDCFQKIRDKIFNHIETEHEKILLIPELNDDIFKSHTSKEHETAEFLARVINYTDEFGYKNTVNQSIFSERKATEANEAEANTIIDFFKKYEPKNDFESNIKLLLSKRITHEKYLNFFRFVKQAYEQANETKKTAIDSNATNGEVKSIKVYYRQNSPYYYKDIITGYLIEVKNNHLLLWETNKNIDSDFSKIIGSKITFKIKSFYTSKNGDVINKIKNVKFSF